MSNALYSLYSRGLPVLLIAQSLNVFLTFFLGSLIVIVVALVSFSIITIVATVILSDLTERNLER